MFPLRNKIPEFDFKTSLKPEAHELLNIREITQGLGSLGLGDSASVVLRKMGVPVTEQHQQNRPVVSRAAAQHFIEITFGKVT